MSDMMLKNNWCCMALHSGPCFSVQKWNVVNVSTLKLKMCVQTKIRLTGWNQTPISRHNHSTVTFGLPRVSRDNALGELQEFTFSFLKQSEVHLPPGLVLLQLGIPKVPEAVPLPQVISHTYVHLHGKHVVEITPKIKKRSKNRSKKSYANWDCKELIFYKKRHVALIIHVQFIC